MEGGDHVVEGEPLADVGQRPSGRQEVQQLGLVAAELVGRVGGEGQHLEADDLDALQQHEVERDARDGPGGIAHGHEPAAPTKAAERGFGELATDRVDDNICPVGEGIPQRLAQVAGPVVDQGRRALLLGGVELLRRGRHRRDRSTEDAPQLHGRETDPATGAQHDQLQTSYRTEHVIRGAMGDPEGGGRAGIDAVGNADHRLGADGDLLGEGADHRRAEHPIACGDRVDLGADGIDDARELAAGDEGRRHAHLVPVGDEQHVGEVDRSGGDAHTHLPRAEVGRRDLLDLHDVRRSVRVTDGGPHPSPAQRP